MSAALTVVKRPAKHTKWSRGFLYVFLTFMALVWLVPVVSAIYAAFRPYAETQKYGIFSMPKSLTVQNFKDAWTQGNMSHTFKNTMFIVIPSMALILFFSSTMAFAVSRFSWRFNIALLLLFTAGNLLPAQVIFQPLFQMFKATPWPNFLSDTDTGSLLGTKIAVIIVHVAFQTGFCTFVLSNYMKTIPKELGEAALVDGASVSRQFFQIIMPLCRPVLAALATLEFTWLYNDFFWAVVLINKGDERPITSSIANLGGAFFSNDNLIAAASVIVAMPTLVVYLALQRQFIGGLTLGANKG
ncbi:MAG TPA: carbohydrate ABC transporter permease [Ilumatobacteraceae bacterium]|nr:carbohydrate ABC transporter permease [Ilumatobacteraceae bacterium]